MHCKKCCAKNIWKNWRNKKETFDFFWENFFRFPVPSHHLELEIRYREMIFFRRWKLQRGRRKEIEWKKKKGNGEEEEEEEREKEIEKKRQNYRESEREREKETEINRERKKTWMLGKMTFKILWNSQTHIKKKFVYWFKLWISK